MAHIYALTNTKTRHIFILANSLGKKAIGSGRFEQQVAGYFTANEGFDVGCDTCSPVSDLYESPFAFTGEILRVMVDVNEATFENPAEQHEMHARFAMANDRTDQMLPPKES